jgi:hypothetical protein
MIRSEHVCSAAWVGPRSLLACTRFSQLRLGDSGPHGEAPATAPARGACGIAMDLADSRAAWPNEKKGSAIGECPPRGHDRKTEHPGWRPTRHSAASLAGNSKGLLGMPPALVAGVTAKEIQVGVGSSVGTICAGGTFPAGSRSEVISDRVSRAVAAALSLAGCLSLLET